MWGPDTAEYLGVEVPLRGKTVQWRELTGMLDPDALRADRVAAWGRLWHRCRIEAGNTNLSRAMILHGSTFCDRHHLMP